MSNSAAVTGITVLMGERGGPQTLQDVSPMAQASAAKMIPWYKMVSTQGKNMVK